jgi:integrase
MSDSNEAASCRASRARVNAFDAEFAAPLSREKPQPSMLWPLHAVVRAYVAAVCALPASLSAFAKERSAACARVSASPDFVSASSALVSAAPDLVNALDALAHPKPKLPRKLKKRPRFFTLSEVAKIVVASQGEQKVFYWLAAETGLRAGELAGIRLIIADERLTVNQSVWHGKTQDPKTDNAVRTLALSPQLITLLWEQTARQNAKQHEFLFSASTRAPWDMNVFRHRKMRMLLKSLGIRQAGFHAFRHFNVALLDSLCVPLKVIQERAGHALTGSFTLDVYGGKPEWVGNVEAARKAGLAIEQSVVKAQETEPFVGLTAVKKEKLLITKSEAL